MNFKIIVGIFSFLSLHSFACTVDKIDPNTGEEKNIYRTGKLGFSLKIDKGEKIGTVFYKDKRVASTRGRFYMDLKDNTKILSVKNTKLNLDKLSMSKKLKRYETIRNQKRGLLDAELSVDTFSILLQKVLSPSEFDDVKNSIIALGVGKIDLSSEYNVDALGVEDYRHQEFNLTSSKDHNIKYVVKFKYDKFPKCK